MFSDEHQEYAHATRRRTAVITLVETMITVGNTIRGREEDTGREERTAESRGGSRAPVPRNGDVFRGGRVVRAARYYNNGGRGIYATRSASH